MKKEIKLDNLNRENLRKTIELLKTIDSQKFRMNVFRPAGEHFKTELLDAECNSYGCIIGHSTVLDRILFEEVKKNFVEFSERFFGRITLWQWQWLFGASWHEIDPDLERNIARLEWTLENGFPQNSYIQAMMEREQRLPY